MNESESRQRIAANWAAVEDAVRDAMSVAGRGVDEVRVVGVTKYVTADVAAMLVEAGCHELGESRPQQLWEKAEALAQLDAIHWHAIGHLQRNKVRRTLNFRPTIHSIDSLRLLRAIDQEASAQGIEVTALLEVNISGEQAKTGFAPDDLRAALEAYSGDAIRLNGLMAMAGRATSGATAREQFASLRRLRDELESSTGRRLSELSMGMSGDFLEAIAEGATIVRIGSRLFAGILNEP